METPARASSAASSKPNSSRSTVLYKIADEIEPHLRKKPVQAWLEDETMKITLLD